MLSELFGTRQNVFNSIDTGVKIISIAIFCLQVLKGILVILG